MKEEIKNKLEKIDTVIQQYLDIQDNATFEMQRNKHGYSSHGFVFFDGKKRVTHEKLNSKDNRENLDSVDDFFSEILKEVGTINGKTLFHFKKDQEPKIEDLDTKGIIDRIIEDLRAEITKKGAEKAYAKCLFHFDEEHNYLETKDKAVFIINDERNVVNSGPYWGFSEDCSCLYYFTGRVLSELMFEVSNKEVIIRSNPQINDWAQIPSDDDTFAADKKRLEAISLSRNMREKEFSNIGKMDELVFAPLISPIFSGGSSWPAGRPQFRVLHTSKSTVVISDGLSDCFEDEKLDNELKYNGYGLEFYMEFEGSYSFDEFNGHYVHSVLHSITQVAINHGNIVGVIEKYGTVSIEISGLKSSKKWVNKNGKSGILLIRESLNVPSSITLNLEKVMLVGCRLITPADLEKCSKDDGKYRNKLADKFRKDKSGLYSPFLLQ